MKCTPFLQNIVSALVLSLSSLSTLAADGTIYFTGKIVEASCAVSSESSVTLIDTKTDQLKNKGDTGATKSFSVRLSNCPTTVNSASISFSGTADANNPELFATSGDAQGIGVEIVDLNNANEQRLPPTTDSTKGSQLVAIKPGAVTNTLNFGARYMATTDSKIISGDANSQADFTVTYR